MLVEMLKIIRSARRRGLVQKRSSVERATVVPATTVVTKERRTEMTVMRAARALYCFSTMLERPRRMPETVRRLAAIKAATVPVGRKESIDPDVRSWRRKGMRMAMARIDVRTLSF